MTLCGSNVPGHDEAQHKATTTCRDCCHTLRGHCHRIRDCDRQQHAYRIALCPLTVSVPFPSPARRQSFLSRSHCDLQPPICAPLTVISAAAFPVVRSHQVTEAVPACMPASLQKNLFPCLTYRMHSLGVPGCSSRPAQPKSASQLAAGIA